MNTMHNAVSGRIREIGVLRVLGFGKGRIYLAFLVEALVLCAAAGAIGCLLGWLANGLPMRLPFAAAFPVEVDAWSLAGGFGAALLMGVLGLAFPMIRALGHPAVDAVRAVG
jgi:putative ABC transport system permease protein